VSAAAVAGLARALEVRARLLHPSAAAAAGSGRVSVIYVNVMTVAVVLFLLWFARCRRNAELLSPGRVPGSTAWAVLVWLIPVFNLWAPHGLVRAVDRASAPDGTDDGADARRADLLVNVWWAAWVGRAVLALAAANLAGGTSLPLLVASESLDLLAAALAVVLIQRITVRQAAGSGAGGQVPAPAGLPHVS
jgi:hypothetical protein